MPAAKKTAKKPSPKRKKTPAVTKKTEIEEEIPSAVIADNGVSIPQPRQRKSGNGSVVFLLFLTWGALIGSGVYVYEAFGPRILHLLTAKTEGMQLVVNKQEASPQLQSKISLLESKLLHMQERLDELELEQEIQEVAALPEELPTPARQTVMVEPQTIVVEEKAALAFVQANHTQFAEKENDFRDPTSEKEILGAGLSDVNNKTVELEEKLFSLKEKMATLSKEQATSHFMVAAMHLRDAVFDAKHFGHELEAVKLFTKQQPDAVLEDAIATLSTHARNGVADHVQLQRQFQEIVDQALYATRQEEENPGFWDKVVMRLSGVVKIRKKGSQLQGDTIEDRLARAEAFLEKHDIESAIREVSLVEGEAAAIMHPWLENAQQSVEAKQAAIRVFDHVLGMVKDQHIATSK